MKVRWSIPVLATLLVVCVSAAPARADVIDTTLWRLAVMSDVVVDGRVVRVVEVPAEPTEDVDESFTSVALAEVEILARIKGDLQTKTVWVFATSTWICDVSHAKAGERALWFLEARGVADVISPGSLLRVADATGGAPVHRIAWDGRGRMPIRQVGGEDSASIWVTNVLLPAEIETIPGPNPRFAYSTREARVADVRAFIERGLARAARPPEEVPRAERLLRSLDEVPFGVRWKVESEILSTADGLAPGYFDVVRDPASPWRENAAEVLGALKPVELLEDLRSEDLVRRRAAAFAFDWLSRQDSADFGDDFPEAAREALRDIDAEVRWRVLRTLVQRDRFGDEPYAVVLAALEDESEDVVWHAARSVRALTWFGVVEEPATRLALETRLLGLARHPSRRVRRSVWEALGGVTFETREGIASQASWVAARNALMDPDPVVRIGAISAIGQVPGAEAVTTLVELARSSDAWSRRAAVHALGINASNGVVAPLVIALRDEDPEVSVLAALALGDMGRDAAEAIPSLEAVLRRLTTTDRDVALSWVVRSVLEDIWSEVPGDPLKPGDEPVIRYVGFPGSERLLTPFEGTTSLDPVTGLPRKTSGCIAIPGEKEKIEAHNRRVRAAWARGELRKFQLNHKFRRRDDLLRRFESASTLLLAPDSPVETSDGRFRVEVHLEDRGFWQGYLFVAGEPARRIGLGCDPGTELSVLFDDDGTSLLVKVGDDRYEIHDLPTRAIVQVTQL